MEDGAEFAPAFVTCSDDFPKWNGLSCQLSGYRGAKEAILVKDADFAHIPGIIANCDVFPYVRGQRERNISQTLKVTAIATHPAGSYCLQQQKVKLLERFGHAWQKPAF